MDALPDDGSNNPLNKSIMFGKRAILPHFTVLKRTIMTATQERMHAPVKAPVTMPVDAPGDNDGGTESLEKVRDILFGAQNRETDKRFKRIEDRVEHECRELRDEFRKRLDSLEQYFRGEVQSLTDRIRTEQKERTAAVKDLSKEIIGAVKEMEHKVADLDDRGEATNSEIRKQVLDQSKTLRDEIDGAKKQLATVQEQLASDLRSEKVDRNTLGDLFSELALRLKNEFNIPGT